MRRVIQKTVENAVAGKILSQEAHAGTVITLDAQDLTAANPHTATPQQQN